MNPIPIIDISCVDKKALYHQWDDAFRTFGCCILIGHGMIAEEGESEGDIFTEMKKEVMSFFIQPLETKMQFNFGPYGNDRGGYTPRSGESVSQSNNHNNSEEDIDTSRAQSNHNSKKQREKQATITSDPVESFVLNPQTYQQYMDILPRSNVYYKKCEALVHSLHVLSTRALGIPEKEEEDYFRKYYSAVDKDAQGSGIPSFALRLAHYPPQETSLAEGDREHTGHINDTDHTATEPEARYGAHTDYMGFTALRPDESDWSADLEGSGGLEVYDRNSNCWTPVVLPDNIRKTALIINAGDLMQRWTNDRWVSPLHRVTGPKPHSPAAGQSRVALVFFSGPMADALITVCPAACTTSAATTSTKTLGDHGECSSKGENSSQHQQEQVIMTTSAKYEPVVAQDYLMSKINPTALNIAS